MNCPAAGWARGHEHEHGRDKSDSRALRSYPLPGAVGARFAGQSGENRCSRSGHASRLRRHSTQPRKLRGQNDAAGWNKAQSACPGPSACCRARSLHLTLDTAGRRLLTRRACELSWYRQPGGRSSEKQQRPYLPNKSGSLCSPASINGFVEPPHIQRLALDNRLAAERPPDYRAAPRRPLPPRSRPPCRLPPPRRLPRAG